MKQAMSFIRFVQRLPVLEKDTLKSRCIRQFKLSQNGSAYFNEYFAVCFSDSSFGKMSNTITSFKHILHFDRLPFFVCIVTNAGYQFRLCNATFVEKISHSSDGLSMTKIVGSINGPNIFPTYKNLDNHEKNFKKLFPLHLSVSKQRNFKRIVLKTATIKGRLVNNRILEGESKTILKAVERAIRFAESEYAITLKSRLDRIVHKYRKLIFLAERYTGNNVRGKLVEALVTINEKGLQTSMTRSIAQNKPLALPRRSNRLEDLMEKFPGVTVGIDIKTKTASKISNPKGFNIDKFLKFLATEGTVFVYYFININYTSRTISTRLCSPFESDFIEGLTIQTRLSGKGSRGGTLLGNVKGNAKYQTSIAPLKAREFLKRLMGLSGKI